ncbi:WW domain-binding protein 4-like isoform X1 [Asterias rubens]|uniref:WW domain-binding protein 4-like isoform X1 n=1 Tax=Asterias rubens TaxID=7604 RepID=UPI001455555E|nr:WW domain-binding protein 4-like isoform X1 [Asterias rubens]
MATYWKSQPKHHCDFCKCWIADNKPSIDFHERGKRHKENVEKKLKDLRQKGHEQFKIQQTLDQDLIKMEQDALKKFKKDLENDPALAAEYRAKAVAAAATEAAAAKQKEGLLQAARKLHKQGLAKKQLGQPNTSNTQKVTPSTAQATSQAVKSESDATSSSVETAAQCVWLEGTSPEGDTYYWNSATGESQWEKPEDYVATDESTAFKNQAVEEAVNETTEQGDSNDKLDSSESDEEKQMVVADSKPAKAPRELLPPRTEAEKSEESDSDEESEEEPEKTETDKKPAKKKMNNPYGSWATIIPDNTPPVDLQLPTPDRPHFKPVVPQAAQFQPRERMKFKERTVTTLSTPSSSSSSSSGQASFKKRKFGGGGRSIRQRDSDT